MVWTRLVKWVRYRTFGFHTILGNFEWQRLASPEEESAACSWLDSEIIATVGVYVDSSFPNAVQMKPGGRCYPASPSYRRVRPFSLCPVSNLNFSLVFFFCLVSMLGGSLSPQHSASSGCGWRKGLQLWRGFFFFFFMKNPFYLQSVRIHSANGR
jgi:hypothetical protein